MVVVPAAEAARRRPPSHALGPFFVLGVKESQQKEQKETKDLATVASAAGAFAGSSGPREPGVSKTPILGEDKGGVQANTGNDNNGGKPLGAASGEGGIDDLKVSEATRGAVGLKQFVLAGAMVFSRLLRSEGCILQRGRRDSGRIGG